MRSALTADDHAILAEAARDGAVPADVYRAAESVARERVGFGLLTILVAVTEIREVERVWTSDPASYPLAGRKPMRDTVWGRHVLIERRPFVAPDAAAIRDAFPDHALIASLGLETAVNVPVVALGRLLGTVNVLNGPGRLGAGAVAPLAAIAPYLAPALLLEQARLTAAPPGPR
jgi:GAF domain-containing protein